MPYRRHIILLLELAFLVISNTQAPCVTPNSYLGECISVLNCPAMRNFLERRINKLTQDERLFVEQSQCDSTQRYHVCCNNNDTFFQTQFNATTAQPDTNVSIKPGDVLPNPDKFECGLDIFSNRIYGGEDAELGEFPWMALLEYQNNRGVRQFACGGSLITSRYVLTAAHCLVGPVLTIKGRLISVRLGEHNVNTTEDCEEDGNVRVCADAVLDIPVEQSIPYSSFNPSDRNQHNDIGLVRLEQKVSYSFYIRPICLPSAQLRTPTGSNLTVVGWGATLEAPRSAKKQKISIPVTDQQQCGNTFKRIAVEIVDTQLCAGGEFARDSCTGDSGGPLMPRIDSKWYAEGVVSSGYKCGLRGWSGIYVRVPSYLDWISSNLKP